MKPPLPPLAILTPFWFLRFASPPVPPLAVGSPPTAPGLHGFAPIPPLPEVAVASPPAPGAPPATVTLPRPTTAPAACRVLSGVVAPFPAVAVAGPPAAGGQGSASWPSPAVAVALPPRPPVPIWRVRAPLMLIEPFFATALNSPGVAPL